MKRKIMIGVTIIFTVIIIYSISKSYSLNKAIENGDFINYPSVINYDKFEEFLTMIDSNSNSKLRITTFSKEGEPEIRDLVYENELFSCRKFNPEGFFDKELEIYYFSELICEESERYIEYYFDDQKKNEKILLVQIPK